MIPNRTSLNVVVATLVLVAAPSLALAQRGGGGRHGGRPGGGHAVPRGGAGHASPGIAGARHPRAGTGTGGYHGGYGYRHGGYYKPYHGYYPYYRPYYPYASFWFGWPYYYSSWWPYASEAYYPPVYSAPAPSYGYDMGGSQPPAEYAPSRDREAAPEPDPPSDTGRGSPPNTGRVRIEVRPGDASVYVDDEFWGNARETKQVILRAGPHVVELVRPGFATLRREVEVVPGETTGVSVELERP